MFLHHPSPPSSLKLWCWENRDQHAMIKILLGWTLCCSGTFRWPGSLRTADAFPVVASLPPKIQDTSAREVARSHSSCILSFDLIGLHQNKRFYVTEIVLPLGFADAIFRRERSDDRKCVCCSQASGQVPGCEVWHQLQREKGTTFLVCAI